MKIYESLDLCKNTVSNVVIGTTGADVTGGIKYVSSGNKLQLYYLGGWHDIGGSSPTPDYVSGNFTIGPSTTVGNSGTELTGSGTMDVFAASGQSGDTNTPTDLKYRVNEGKLIIGTTTGNSDNYLSLDVASSVAGEMVFFSTFNSETYTNLYITISNPLKTSNVVVSVYEQFTYKPTTGGSGDRAGWEKIGCEVQIKNPQDNCDILLTLTNVSTNKQFKVVVVGAKSTITGSGTSAAESNISAKNQSDNGNTTKANTNPITRV
jgi:hypothetical protein